VPAVALPPLTSRKSGEAPVFMKRIAEIRQVRFAACRRSPGAAKGLNIREPKRHAGDLRELRNHSRGRTDDIFFHGHRLRHYSDTSPHRSADAADQREDAGEVFSSLMACGFRTTGSRPPTAVSSWSRVKNCHTGDPQEPFEIKKEYLHGLRPMRPRSDADSSSPSIGQGRSSGRFSARRSQRRPSRSTITMIESAPAQRMHVWEID